MLLLFIAIVQVWAIWVLEEKLYHHCVSRRETIGTARFQTLKKRAALLHGGAFVAQFIVFRIWGSWLLFLLNTGICTLWAYRIYQIPNQPSDPTLQPPPREPQKMM